VVPELRLVDKFLGIPFAEPPVGDNRFRAPQPIKQPWGPDARPAVRAGSPCPQFHLVGDILYGQEDCLYLNIFAPANRSDEPLPVFLWIYGGAYMLGDGEEFGEYDGGHLVVRHNVIVVSFNYRLAGLGFFALPELQNEDPDGSTGNYGLQDQQAAMRWVQKNIKNFGGDPTRVTMAGESAGGFSTMWHLVQPRSKGLFSAAISESGTSRTDWFFQPLENATSFYSRCAEDLGCKEGQDRLECLRKVPFARFNPSVVALAKDVITGWLHIGRGMVPGAFPFMAFSAVIDGSPAGLTDSPLALMQKGQFNKVPLIVGANKEDGDIFFPVIPVFNPKPSVDFTTFIQTAVKNTTAAQQVLEAYSLDEFGNDGRRGARFMRDVIFQCPARDVARAFADAGGTSYLYVFSFDFGKKWMETIGDCHAMELPFLFRNYEGILGKLFNLTGYEALSDALGCAWMSFVTCHAPQCQQPIPSCADNDAHVPAWPQYDRGNQKFNSIKASPEIGSIQELKYPQDVMSPDSRCDLLASFDLAWDDLARAQYMPNVVVV